MSSRGSPADLSGRRVADAPPTNLVDRFAPAAWKPWLRLARYDRPIGSWLLMWPCQWSAALAAVAAGSTAELPRHVGLFLIGAFVMRGAGSTWNDFLDRDIDGRVERTRNRPIPAGQVSAKQALAFAIAQSLVGLLVLLQFNTFAILLGIASLLPVAVYPLMKRIMGYPQAVLGLCFAWGALMGFAAVFARLPWPALVLYAGAICWVIGYDTIYGHQDQRDDAVIGVKSTSRTFGRWSRPLIALHRLVEAEGREGAAGDAEQRRHGDEEVRPARHHVDDAAQDVGDGLGLVHRRFATGRGRATGSRNTMPMPIPAGALMVGGRAKPCVAAAVRAWPAGRRAPRPAW